MVFSVDLVVFEKVGYIYIYIYIYIERERERERALGLWCIVLFVRVLDLSHVDYLSDEFKLKPITIYYLKFVVKML